MRPGAVETSPRRTSFHTFIDNPALMAYELFGFEASDDQRAVMDAVAAAARPDADRRGVTWRSSHGVGKTACEAILIFWFLLCHPRSKVITTAPTWHQVKNVLWAEIHKWYGRFAYQSLFDLTTTTLKHRAMPAEWNAIGVASNRPERVEGVHAPYFMAVIDECKGVADDICAALDGACTPPIGGVGHEGIRLYCSTPGPRMGQFWKSHSSLLDAGFFWAFHTDGETIAEPAYQKYVAQKRQEWGRDSGIYQSKIRGEFPQEGEDILIPLSYLDAAEESWHMTWCDTCDRVEDESCSHDEGQKKPAVGHGPHLVLGADIAAYGFNETAVVDGSVTRLDGLRTWQHEGPAASADYLIARRDEVGASLIGIDALGIGAGGVEQFRIREVPFRGIKFTDPPTKAKVDVYANKKAEIVFNFRALLEANFLARRSGQVGTFAMQRDDRMFGQLSQIRKRQKMKRGVPQGWLIMDPDDPHIPPGEIPRGLKVSPDRAHAAVLCYHTARLAGTTIVGEYIDPDEGRNNPLYSGFKRGRYSSMMGLDRPTRRPRY